MNALITTLCAIWFFYFGACMGSFYNVLIDRLPKGQDVIKSRSICTNCNTTLKFFDLIPIFSFIFLRRKCRYCGTKLTFQYLFSEIAVGCIFLLAFFTSFYYGRYVEFFLRLALWSMLYIVMMMDFKFMVVMDVILLIGGIFGIGIRLYDKVSPVEILLGMVAGLVFYGLIYLIARFAFRKEGFGLGDVFLLTAIGAFFDYKETVATGILAFYVCVPLIIFLSIRNKKLEKQTEIPFAPSMCIAAFIITLYGKEIITYFMGILGFR